MTSDSVLAVERASSCQFLDLPRQLLRLVFQPHRCLLLALHLPLHHLVEKRRGLRRQAAQLHDLAISRSSPKSSAAQPCRRMKPNRSTVVFRDAARWRAPRHRCPGPRHRQRDALPAAFSSGSRARAAISFSHEGEKTPAFTRMRPADTVRANEPHKKGRRPDSRRQFRCEPCLRRSLFCP